ncbi:hypothetical protein EDM80_11140 [bacterium]|nr:MAG: hypothetical protein EDM80_11140 [bacterium]
MSKPGPCPLLVAGCLLAALWCTPLHAEVDRSSLPPVPVSAEQREALLREFRAEETPRLRKELEAELEKKFRAELEQRLEQERRSYEGSVINLWASNAAVWGALLLFIVWQALSAGRMAREVARLKAARETS